MQRMKNISQYIMTKIKFKGEGKIPSGEADSRRIGIKNFSCFRFADGRAYAEEIKISEKSSFLK